jgi:Arc/MetJ-type ribon-helix-helix transcriptional regulator
MVVKDPSPLIALRVPRELLEEVDRLTRRGKFVSRSDAIRDAIRAMLSRRAECEGDAA